jgi:hypothetical protein
MFGESKVKQNPFQSSKQFTIGMLIPPKKKDFFKKKIWGVIIRQPTLSV